MIEFPSSCALEKKIMSRNIHVLWVVFNITCSMGNSRAVMFELDSSSAVV